MKIMRKLGWWGITCTLLAILLAVLYAMQVPNVSDWSLVAGVLAYTGAALLAAITASCLYAFGAEVVYVILCLVVILAIAQFLIAITNGSSLF